MFRLHCSLIFVVLCSHPVQHPIGLLHAAALPQWLWGDLKTRAAQRTISLPLAESFYPHSCGHLLEGEPQMEELLQNYVRGRQSSKVRSEPWLSLCLGCSMVPSPPCQAPWEHRRQAAEGGAWGSWWSPGWLSAWSASLSLFLSWAAWYPGSIWVIVRCKFNSISEREVHTPSESTDFWGS
jgi:hypothetical protein